MQVCPHPILGAIRARRVPRRFSESRQRAGVRAKKISQTAVEYFD
jgi:hypothetical protein